VKQLGINQPKISALSNYRLEGFSVERLLHFLNAPDRDIEIVIHHNPQGRRSGRILVTAAESRLQRPKATSCSGHVQRLHPPEIGNPMCFAPGREAFDVAKIGAARVRVANVGSEKFSATQCCARIRGR
jgi:hypothetical protein